MEESTGISLAIIGCTIANNTAGGNAGGFSNYCPNCTLTNDTISGNRGINGDVGLFGESFGGGLLSNVPILLQNSIVAGNFEGTGTTPDDIDYPMSASSSYNLIGVGGSGGIVNGVNGNIVGVSNPGLATLANNGGYGQCIALLPGSPAIASGDNAFVAPTATDEPAASSALPTARWTSAPTNRK